MSINLFLGKDYVAYLDASSFKGLCEREGLQTRNAYFDKFASEKLA